MTEIITNRLTAALAAAREAFNHPDALSQSRAKTILDSCVARMIAEPKRPSSPAQALGSLVHCMVLEPTEVERRYHVVPPVNRRTNAGKAEAAAALEAAAGRTVVEEDDYATATAMGAKILAHPHAAFWLEQPGLSEVKLGWTDPATGVRAKGVLDRLAVEDRAVREIKTAQEAGVAGFQKAIGNHRYHVQAALYVDGASLILEQAGLEPVQEFGFIVVESTAPFEVACYTLDATAIDRGRRLYQEAFRQWGAYLADRQAWHGYPLGLSIGIPRWA